MKKMMTNKKRGAAMIRLLSLVGGVGLAYAASAAAQCTDDPVPCEMSEIVGYGCHTPIAGSCCQYIQFRCYGSQTTFFLRSDGPGSCIDFNKGPATDFQCQRAR
jgi:hypothetical protein